MNIACLVHFLGPLTIFEVVRKKIIVSQYIEIIKSSEDRIRYFDNVDSNH